MVDQGVSAGERSGQGARAELCLRDQVEADIDRSGEHTEEHIAGERPFLGSGHENSGNFIARTAILALNPTLVRCAAGPHHVRSWGDESAEHACAFPALAVASDYRGRSFVARVLRLERQGER